MHQETHIESELGLKAQAVNNEDYYLSSECHILYMLKKNKYKIITS